MATKKQTTKLQCETCKEINYFTRKSKKVGEIKLGLKKYCSRCRKHTMHKEAKR